MHKLLKPIFWTFLFLVMMLAIDQLLVQLPPVHPAQEAVSRFYRDLRGRLIDLAFAEKKAAPQSVEAVIEKEQKREQKSAPTKSSLKQKPATQAVQAPSREGRRYLYADGQGELHFVDSLDDVPEQYRGQAQPMGQ